jgi:hypothetical protein
MKNIIKFILFLLIIGLFMNPLIAQEPEKENISVLRFGGWRGGYDETYQNSLTDKISTLIIQSHRFNVIDRVNLDKIIQEQGLQMTGVIDDQTAVEFGRLAGVQKFIIGSFTQNSTNFHAAKFEYDKKKKRRIKVSDAYYTADIQVAIKMLDVETGQYIEATEAGGSGRGSNEQSAYSNALGSVATNVVNAFFKYFAIQAFIESISYSNVIIDRGTSLGVKPLMNFEVLSIHKSDLQEDRKADISIETKRIGILRIVSAEQSSAKGRLIGDYSLVRPGNLIREIKEDVKLEASIIQKKFGEVVINMGSEVGVKKGTIFKVIEKGKEFIDPVTGESYGSKEVVKGIIHVNKVQERFSEAKIIKGRYIVDKGMTLKETSSWKIANIIISGSYILTPIEGDVNIDPWIGKVKNKYIEDSLSVNIDYSNKDNLEKASMIKFQAGVYNSVNNLGMNIGLSLLSMGDDVTGWALDISFEKHFGLIPELLYLYPGFGLGVGSASQIVEPDNNPNLINDLSDGNNDKVSSTKFMWNGKLGARIVLGKLNIFGEVDFMGLTFNNWEYKIKTGEEDDEGEEKEETITIQDYLLPYPEVKFGGPNIRFGLSVAF